MNGGPDGWACSKHQVSTGDVTVCHLCGKKIEVGDKVGIAVLPEHAQGFLDQLFAQAPRTEVFRWIVKNGGTVTLADGTVWEDGDDEEEQDDDKT